MNTMLKSLVIENFRSIRGEAVIPLDAQVVLIHGSNGMGKTSILSALELGLTGRIAHLAEEGQVYKKYLTNFGSNSGRIELNLTNPLAGSANKSGLVEFSDKNFSEKALLGPDHARFFSERCFLPQSALGRLLEIYDDKKTTTNSPLTLFVKELLGLDPLDALVDGLHPAFHVSRLRNLTPSYKRVEELKTSLQSQLAETGAKEKQRQLEIDKLEADLSKMIAEFVPVQSVNLEEQDARSALRAQIEASRDDHSGLQKAHRLRSEIRSAIENWRNLPKAGDGENISNLESAYDKATLLFHSWSKNAGKELDVILDEMRDTFPDTMPSDRGPERARAFAEERAQSEVTRCEALIGKADEAERQRIELNSTIQRATAKLKELDENLRVGVTDIQAFARALAGVAPHISDDSCPVCDRNFIEMGRGSLAAHVAAKIGSLTTEAGKLQAVAEERAAEHQTLITAQRKLLSVDQESITQGEMAELRAQRTVMLRRLEALKAMQTETQKGAAFLEEASGARTRFRTAQKNSELVSAMITEIRDLVADVTDIAAFDSKSLDALLNEAMERIEKRVADIEASQALRVSCLRSLDSYEALTSEVAQFKEKAIDLANRIEVVESAFDQISQVREDAKKVSTAASSVRSAIVKRVFSESLNTLWRDLFLRLAPSEQFVPAFKLPTDAKGNVEAILETLHRSGAASGSPGAMLSQGNLNTAALTLFLALHLSVPLKQPWLVLDDPVQSMDDVHITQMAALLRTLSKGMNRQIVVAVHERALFDYLTLELSPAFPGDSLITVEVSKNFEGKTVISPMTFAFEKDPAIAA